MPSSEEILSIDSDKVAAFIQQHASAKTLSALIKQLNDALIAGDAAASQMASRALQHLGFPEYA